MDDPHATKKIAEGALDDLQGVVELCSLTAVPEAEIVKVVEASIERIHESMGVLRRGMRYEFKYEQLVERARLTLTEEQFAVF